MSIIIFIQLTIVYHFEQIIPVFQCSIAHKLEINI